MAETHQQARRAKRLARQIGVFARRHGGSAEAAIAYLGERGARIVLVGANGDWGDLVAPTYSVAEQAVTRSGVPRHETFDGAFAARLRTGRYEWTRMAGIQLGGRTGTGATGADRTATGDAGT